MEQHRRVRCEGALAVVFTIAALSPQPTGAQYADAAAVVGTMANLETGQPAEGLVTLIAGHPDNLAGTERTRGGMFLFAGVPRGPAVVLARADGYAPYFGALTIEAGEQNGVRIVLPEATTSGVVLDGNGCPAAGAHVHVGYNRALPGAGLLSVLTRARTVTRSAPGAARASPGESTPTGKVADLLARPADRLDDHRQREVTVRGPAPPPPAGGSFDPAAHPC